MTGNTPLQSSGGYQGQLVVEWGGPEIDAVDVEFADAVLQVALAAIHDKRLTVMLSGC